MSKRPSSVRSSVADSPAALGSTMVEVLKYNLTDVAGSIVTPLLVTDPENEQFWPDQSEKLAALLPGETELVKFAATEGANYHCQPLARLLTEQRMFDWLDSTLGC